MRSVCVQRYDLRTERVGDEPLKEWAIANDVYTRVAIDFTNAPIRSAVDTVVEGTVHSFRTELSNMEGEERG